MKSFRRTFTPLHSVCVFVPAAVLGTILGKLYGLSNVAGVAGAILVMVACAFIALAFQHVTSDERETVTLDVDGKSYVLPNHQTH